MRLSRIHHRFIATLFFMIGVGLANITFAASTLKSPLIGIWNFQTVIGTEDDKDIIGTGVMQIAPLNKGQSKQFSAKIVWLDDKGIGRSTRDIHGELKNAQMIFTHNSVRTHTSGKGKAINTDVTVTWTLQASASALMGTRAVRRSDGEIDDDDTSKPVSGTRSISASLPAVIPMEEQQERGPSTIEERARVVKISVDAQTNLQQVYEQNNIWLNQWIEDVPDFNYNAGAVALWVKKVAPTGMRAQFHFQYHAGVMAFQINHPAQKEQQFDCDVAGVEAVLHAYEKLLVTNPAFRSNKLAQAIDARNKGELAALIQTLSGRDQ